MEWLKETLGHYPEIAVFFVLAAGFFIGKLRIGKFTLGTVTAVLLVGILVGQWDIHLTGSSKAIFFLLFLFSMGYSIGPQFFQGLKKDGLSQALHERESAGRIYGEPPQAALRTAHPP